MIYSNALSSLNHSLAGIAEAFHTLVLNLCVWCKADLMVVCLLQQHVPLSPVTQHDCSHRILQISQHSKHNHDAQDKRVAFTP